MEQYSASQAGKKTKQRSKVQNQHSTKLPNCTG